MKLELRDMIKPERLTPQQQMALEEKYRALAMIDEYNNSLDRKATTLIQISGLVVALVTAFGLPDILAQQLSWKPTIVLASIYAPSLLMVFLSVLAWFPRNNPMPGSEDWTEVQATIVLANLDDSFNQTLANCRKSFKILQDANSKKNRLVQWAAVIFILQIIGIPVVALING